MGSLVAATLPRLNCTKEPDAAAAQQASSPPLVSVATARRAPATLEKTLPGNALAFREAALYARSTGYLKRWLMDIGDRAKEGQLIAEIGAPDVDDQLAQARANLVLAKANLNVSKANAALANITLKRDLATGVGVGVSQQTIDQDGAQVKTTTAQIESAKANIQVNEATVQQFADLQSFQKIVAQSVRLRFVWCNSKSANYWCQGESPRRGGQSFGTPAVCLWVLSIHPHQEVR